MMTKINPLLSLREQGQSVWLDSLSRRLITSGELKRLVAEDGVCGLTSNPSIFEKAIADGGDYQDILEAPASQCVGAKALYERIVVRDIQDASDILWPVYLKTKRRDGYVSLEVSPRLAHETQGTIEEARRLWQMVARENLMIKVPGTPQGIAAVQHLIGEGINVNVTLLFSQETYAQAAAAYLGGLESLARMGGDLSKAASVASFFISRIDTAVDNFISERLKTLHNSGEQAEWRSLLGKTACACAQKTYQKYLEILRGDRWLALSRLGAQTQRLLWASTGTKNPAYSDVLYIEELIGPDTVNTMPPASIEAFRNHGRARPALTQNGEEAISIMDLVKQVGIPLKELTDKLLAEGLIQFTDAFDKLLKVTDVSNKMCDPDPIEFLKIKLLKELEMGRHRL
jgi:transaldolase/glucose-6-phosphate isomerase